MKYDHMVKANGIYYQAGQDVPEGNKNPSGISLNAKDVISEKEKETEDKGMIYKKSDIQTMKKDDLVSLAKENGIENADEVSGNELKKALIEKLGL